jgi:hypothetical protein
MAEQRSRQEQQPGDGEITAKDDARIVLIEQAITNSQTLNIDFCNYEQLKLHATPINVLIKRLKKYTGCNVVNLSNIDLDPDLINLLSFGLSFCPTPKTADLAKMFENIEAFFRKLKLKSHFDRIERLFNVSQSSPNNTQDVPPPPLLKIRGTWTPECKDPSLNQYIHLVRKELLTTSNKNRTRPNLTKGETDKITQLSKNPEIVIKKADKGNSIVILNTIDYLTECFKQLSDPKFYTHVPFDLTTKHEAVVNRTVQSLFSAKIIDLRMKKYLWAQYSRTAKFYILPKIHKSSIPGRPIVSATNCPTERLSELVDALLNPLVSQTKSYIRDTTDFINKIATITLKPGSIIATCDVKALYTNIDHQLGLKCIAKKLRKNPIDGFPSHRILEILRIVLKGECWFPKETHQLLMVNYTK